MERVCFLLRVRADRLAEYRERHRAVWSEMREALAECGWGNYTLFLRADGLLVGYLECEDFEAAQRCMEAREVNARWQAEMAPFFELPAGDRPGSDPAAPGRIPAEPGSPVADAPWEEAAGPVFERLEEVFHLA